VIHEVDEALRNVIKQDALRGTDVEVVFDAPTRDWSSRRNAPTIDIYLYDIREDVRRRTADRRPVVDVENRVVGRSEPPRWYKLSYLLTAWTQRPEDEHRLLSAALASFLRHESLPSEALTGSLAELGLALPVTCGLPPPQDRSLSDVWSALGGELKPSLDVIVTAPFDLGRLWPAGPPVLESTRLVVGRETKHAPHRGGKAKTPAPPEPEIRAATRPLASEERTGGAAHQPGRRLRITELPR